MPAMKKTRRISGSSARKENFMGTDFTYDDMGGRNIDEDTHRLLKELNIEGFRCWVIESVPKDSGGSYSKTISWIRQDALVAVKVEFYDKRGSLLKTLVVSDVRKQDDIWTPFRMEMKNVQKDHSTVIEITEIQYNTGLEDSLFRVSTLERGRIK